MRLLVVAIAAGLAVSACASGPSTTDSGAGPTGQIGTAAPSGSPGSVDPGTGTGSAPGGTSTAGAGSSVPGPTSGAQPVDDRCPANLDGKYNTAQAKPVPSGIEVDWVLRCTVKNPHSDHSRSLLIERSDSEPGALLAALRAPDEPPHAGPCPAIEMLVPYFTLVQRDGTRFLPRLPLTGCALPQPAAMQALQALRFSVIAEKPLP